MEEADASPDFNLLWRDFCYDPWFHLRSLDPPEVDSSTLLPPYILAVLNNDVGQLEKLFQNGLSPSINTDLGNNLLHIAAIKKKTDVFLYLLQRGDFNLDAKNLAKETALTLVLCNRNFDYAKYLINAGAKVNLKTRDSYSPLHYGIRDLEMTKLLFAKGADVNAVSWCNETPLYCACYGGDSNNVAALELLLNGADPTICTKDKLSAFDHAISECKELPDFLFHWTFDKFSTFTLMNIIRTSNTKYFDILTHEFTCGEYSSYELSKFARYLEGANVYEFTTLLNTNPNIIIDLFSWEREDVFYNFFYSLTLVYRDNWQQKMVTKLEILFSNTDVIPKIMERYQQWQALLWNLADRPFDLNEITKLACLFMMHGIRVYAKDLFYVYNCHGYCELLEIMLHMDIVDQCLDLDESLITVLMYNMNYDMDVCLQKPEKFIFETNINGLIQHFALPKFKEYCLKIGNSTQIERVKNLPTIPSLVELSRNAARKLIKKKFNVKTSCQFYTTLNSLPIPKCHKDIITFKTPLYNV